MFIERSAGRIRLARIIFVVAGLVPCLLLATWALERGSAAHRDAVRRTWQRAVGLELTIEGIAHPRPGVVVATGCEVRSSAGRPLFTIPVVEVESADTEDRIRITSLSIDENAAAALGDLAREWLRSDARHPRNCVVELGEVEWPGQQVAREGLRVECVRQDETRAIRIMRSGGDHGRDGDEMRVVRMIDADGRRHGERFEFDAHLARPASAAVVAAAAGWGEAAATMLAGATISGDVHATVGDRAASGTATGRIDGIDLGSCATAVNAEASGIASVMVRRLVWRDGRLADVVLEGTAGPGWINAALFDRLVIALGCRPGPAAVDGHSRRLFDSAACMVELDGGRMMLRTVGGTGGIAMTDDRILLLPPGTPVGFDRIAWMVSPPAAAFVPAAGPGAWLMSIVPDSSGSVHGASRSFDQGDRRGF